MWGRVGGKEGQGHLEIQKIHNTDFLLRYRVLYFLRLHGSLAEC